jgi:hypothetical protein
MSHGPECLYDGSKDNVTPGVERLQTRACGVVVAVISGGVTSLEIGRGI